MKSPNYGDDPEHYKHLIEKINGEANFPMYLHQNGYKLAKKSAGSMEFHNDGDRIVLQVSRNPITYFNRNDSADKGLFFKYLLHRNPNFYKTVQLGLEIVDRTYGLEKIGIDVKKNVSVAKSLEENYHIVPLRNSSYLRIQRGISQTTLNSFPFKARIFNAYHIKDDGGRIANIAFPKYDLEGGAKNYILYNKPYRSKADNKIKKFRLVLNQKDHFLFHSGPVKNPAKIVFGESGIDLLSYHELHGEPDNFYVSLGGNVYGEKLAFFVQLTEPLLATKSVGLVSIMDNDSTGHQYDIKVFTAVINRFNPNIYMETSFRQDNVSMNIHYTEKIRGLITSHVTILNEKLTSDLRKDDLVFDPVRCTGFSDKILLEFSLSGAVGTYHIEKRTNVFKTLIDTINALYLPFPMNIHKSQGKDWNEDLIAFKKMKYLKMPVVDPNAFSLGDKIELNSSKGPEGTINQGIIKTIKSNGVECDFGLQYTYAIPFSAIKEHCKKIVSQHIEHKGGKFNTSNKNNNLQNHIT